MGLVAGLAVLVLASLVFGMLLGHGGALARALAGSACATRRVQPHGSQGIVVPLRRASRTPPCDATAGPYHDARLAA